MFINPIRIQRVFCKLKIILNLLKYTEVLTTSFDLDSLKTFPGGRFPKPYSNKPIFAQQSTGKNTFFPILESGVFCASSC